MISEKEDPGAGQTGMLEVLDGAVLIIDPANRYIIDANRRARELMGMSNREMRERTASEVFARSRLGGIDGLEPLLSGEESSISLRHEGKAGLLEVVARSFHDHGRRRTMLILEEQAGKGPVLEMERLRREKDRAFRQLESEKRFVDAIIDNAESMIIGMDMDGTVSIFNRKAEQSTGLGREEVIGQNYFSLFETEVGPEGGRAWLSDMALGKGSAERIKALPGKGGELTIWWHNKIIESGDQLVLIGVGIDITERVSLNQRLEGLNQSLLLLNRIMCHDIMNDLSVALGSIHLYETKREGRFLDTAIRSLTKSVDLIHDISDLERLRAPTELRSVKVREAIDRAVANRAGQNVTVNVRGEATALADETLVSVIDNLVGNAIMHGDSKRVDIEVREEGGQCLITVADQGKGIPDEIKALVFDEGFKSGETGNTGFGLYIVKKTMEKYGGSVVVRDNQPSGAVFELRLRLGRKA
jgi:PAS domain S-box-containing protein